MSNPYLRYIAIYNAPRVCVFILLLFLVYATLRKNVNVYKAQVYFAYRGVKSKNMKRGIA